MAGRNPWALAGRRLRRNRVAMAALGVFLLDDLQDELHLTYIFIAHDLGVVRHVSDRIAVMYLGKIVQVSPAEEFYQRPVHPYTEALLSAVPIPDPDLSDRRPKKRSELSTRSVLALNRAAAPRYGSFSNTATWLWLADVKGIRSQPAQRSLSRKPAILAIRSSSDGQT